MSTWDWFFNLEVTQYPLPWFGIAMQSETYDHQWHHMHTYRYSVRGTWDRRPNKCYLRSFCKQIPFFFLQTNCILGASCKFLVPGLPGYRCTGYQVIGVCTSDVLMHPPYPNIENKTPKRCHNSSDPDYAETWSLLEPWTAEKTHFDELGWDFEGGSSFSSINVICQNKWSGNGSFKKTATWRFERSTWM